MSNDIDLDMGQVLPKKIRILIVENLQKTLDEFEMSLNPDFFELKFASSPEEGLEYLDLFYPQILLTDMRFAKKGGYALLRAVRKERLDLDLCIVVATQLTDQGILRCADYGVQGYLGKPFARDKLQAEILRFYAKKNANHAHAVVRGIAQADLEPEKSRTEGVKGAFSERVVKSYGMGTTARKERQVTYWYAEEQVNGDFSLRLLNEKYLPHGDRRMVSRKEFLDKFHPEITLYTRKVLPALGELNKTIARADRHRRTREPFSAAMEYQNALKMDETNTRAMFGLGLIYLEMQDKKKAEGVFQALVQMEAPFQQEHKHLFNDFGIEMRRNAMFDEAIQYYERALDLCQTEDDHLFFNLARAHYEKGDWEGCLRNTISALDIDPQSDEAYKLGLEIFRHHLCPALCAANKKPTVAPSLGKRAADLLTQLQHCCGLSTENLQKLRKNTNARIRPQDDKRVGIAGVLPVDEESAPPKKSLQLDL